MAEEKEVRDCYYFYRGIPLHREQNPADHVDRLGKLEFQEGDVMLVGYPKSGESDHVMNGTHWLQQVMWLIQCKADTNLQKDVGIVKRVPIIDTVKEKGGCDLDDLEATPHPWLVKTHMPAAIFDKQIREKKCKIIVLIRNPKDVMVSSMYFYRSFGVPETKDMATFFEHVKKSEHYYGEWLDNVLSWWHHSHLPHVHVIKYEDMKADPRTSIRQLAEFMEVELTADQVKVIVEQTTFTALKNNPAVNQIQVPGFDDRISPIMRKGVVGDWRQHFTNEMSDYIEEVAMKPARQYGLTFNSSL